jgi:hypothetical protein
VSGTLRNCFSSPIGGPSGGIIKIRTSPLTRRTLRQAVWDIREVGYSLEQMARSFVESGEYRITSRLEPQAEYHPPDNSPKLVAAVVDVETTGTNPDRDKIVELGICLFEYDRQTGRIYKVLGSWEWFEDPRLFDPT